MVYFEAIGILDEDEDKGKIRIFQNLNLFDAFRKRIWNQDPATYLNYLTEWIDQNCFERSAERRLHFPPRSLDGVCLVFGTKEEAAKKLMGGAAEILTDPLSKVYLRISTAEGKILSRVEREGDKETYCFEYPIEEALFPSGINLLELFDQFSATRQTQTEGGHVMVLE